MIETVSPTASRFNFMQCSRVIIQPKILSYFNFPEIVQDFLAQKVL